jgi:dihydrofolate reductase
MRRGRGVRLYLDKRRIAQQGFLMKGAGMRPVVLHMGAKWTESSIAGGDLAEGVHRRKREPGGVVLVHGGATFVDALIPDGLIDEYRLVIRLVAIGRGTGLFSALREPLRLDLIEARRCLSGTAFHVYRPKEGNR